jgi:hypothetical protein
VVVAGAAVCELADGDEACVSCVEAPLRHAAGDTGGFYVETWGSTTIPYDVSVELEPGLVPLLVTYTGKAGDDPHTLVTFDRWGCRVELNGAGGRPWLGELSMFVGRAPELYERTFLTLPYTMGLDFARYNRMTAPFPY